VPDEDAEESANSRATQSPDGMAQPKKPVITGDIFAGGFDLSELSTSDNDNRPKIPAMTPEDIVQESPELPGLGAKKRERVATLMASLGNGDTVGDDPYAHQEEGDDPDEALKEKLPAIKSFLDRLDTPSFNGHADDSSQATLSVRDTGDDGNADAAAGGVPDCHPIEKPVSGSGGRSGRKTATVDLQKLFAGGE
jgi:hypothetical protein